MPEAEGKTGRGEVSFRLVHGIGGHRIGFGHDRKAVTRINRAGNAEKVFSKSFRRHLRTQRINRGDRCDGRGELFRPRYVTMVRACGEAFAI